MKRNLEKRLEALEQKQAKPGEYVLLWANEDANLPLEPGEKRIQLKWADDP